MDLLKQHWPKLEISRGTLPRMSDYRTLADLENQLGELIAEAANRTDMTGSAIGIELEDCDGIRTVPPQKSPDLWDPDGKIRRIYAEILALRKRIDASSNV